MSPIRELSIKLWFQERGSAADTFCRRYLQQLDVGNNKFLMVKQVGSEFEYFLNMRVWVEVKDSRFIELLKLIPFEFQIFYTGAIDLPANFANDLEPVGTKGRGESRPTGIPIDANCSICDL